MVPTLEERETDDEFDWTRLAHDMGLLEAGNLLSDALKTDDELYGEALSFIDHGNEDGLFSYRGYEYSKRVIQFMLLNAYDKRKESLGVTELTKQNGVYAWLSVPGNYPASLFIPTLAEDLEKSETAGFSLMVPITAGMLGIAGGGVEPGETESEAIIRELKDELQTSISPEQLTNHLPSFPVIQKRQGKLVELTAVGFQAHLNATQVGDLLNKQNAVYVPNAELTDFLKENRYRLRPYVYRAGRLLASRWRV